MSQLPIYGYVVGFAHHFLQHATVGLPDDALWVPAVILLILGAAATVDALTEAVPDPLIFLGLFAVTAAQGLYVSWPFASHHLLIAIAAGLVISAVNEFCYKMLGDHVFFTGDIKWTILAVSCFDTQPVLYAWGIALSFGIVKVMAHRMFAPRPLETIYLAPYLFPGLLVSLYVLRVSLHSEEGLIQAIKALFL